MNISNYIFIGLIFTFMIELIVGSKNTQNYPAMKKTINEHWHLGSRIACVFIWPIGILIFLTSFIKTIIKK